MAAQGAVSPFCDLKKKQHGIGPPGTQSLNALLLMRMRALAQASSVAAKGTGKCSATARKTKDAVWTAAREGRRECRRVAARA
jgi:hypothetical protein